MICPVGEVQCCRQAFSAQAAPMQVIAEHGAAFSTASLKAMPYLEQ